MGVSGIQSNCAEAPYGSNYPEYRARYCMHHMVSPRLDGLINLTNKIPSGLVHTIPCSLFQISPCGISAQFL